MIIIKNKYFNHRWAVIGAFILPQLLFAFTYVVIDPLAACGVMAVAAFISTVCMYTREVCGFFTHLLGKGVMAICAAMAYFQSEPRYFMVWVTVYGLLAAVLTLSANVSKQMSVGQYTDNAVVMTDKGARAFQVLHFFSFLGLVILAEIARHTMTMDAWIYFQLLCPSMYYWGTMLWLMFSIKSHVVVNGERVDHYIIRYLMINRKR